MKKNWKLALALLLGLAVAITSRCLVRSYGYGDPDDGCGEKPPPEDGGST